METETKRRVFLLENDVWNKLKDHAKTEDRPVSSVLRRLVREYLRKIETQRGVTA